MKILVLKRIEALKLPAELDVEITEDVGNIIVSFKLPKDGVETPVVKTQKRQPRIKGDKNILATFLVSTPLEGPQILTMGGKEIKSADLREGVLDLLEKNSIRPDMIAAYPDSEGKKQIEGILLEPR